MLWFSGRRLEFPNFSSVFLMAHAVRWAAGRPLQTWRRQSAKTARPGWPIPVTWRAFLLVLLQSIKHVDGLTNNTSRVLPHEKSGLQVLNKIRATRWELAISSSVNVSSDDRKYQTGSHSFQQTSPFEGLPLSQCAALPSLSLRQWC